ncbi:hypothetical protein B7463_g8440, partial [Scytalidium lignicola]
MDPRSDNLYSADDESDAESFSEELSPSDGYFERRQLPNETIIFPPQPSDEPKSKLKANEAWQEALDNTKYLPTDSRLLARPLASSSTTYSPSSSGQPSISASMGHPAQISPSPQPRGSHRTSSNIFYLNSDPPPAYTPPTATNSPVDLPTPTQGSDSQTLNSNPPSPRHIEEGLPPHREPESMGAPEEQSDERTPLWNDTVPSNRIKNRTRVIIQRLLFLALLALNRGNQEIDDPPISDIPSNGDEHYCPLASGINEEKTFSLPLFPMENTLKIMQKTYDDHGSSDLYHVSTRGEIRVRRLPPNSPHGNKAFITTSLNISDPGIVVKQILDEEHHALRIETPVYDNVGRNHRPCISLVVTAWLPKDTVFSNIEIIAVQLGLRVMDDARVKVTNAAEFASISGAVHFPRLHQSAPISRQDTDASSTASESPQIAAGLQTESSDSAKYSIDSRRIVVQTVSGSITGGFPLYDYLELQTTSGSIDVTISPEDILPTAPAPAELSIQTISGSITVTSPIYSSSSTLYARDYRTQVHTNSGTIRGSYLFTSEGSFVTTSATVDVDVLPVLLATAENLHTDSDSSKDHSLLSTTTTSGTTKVNVLEPILLPNTTVSSRRPSPPPPQDLDRFIPIGDRDPYRGVNRVDTEAVKRLALSSLHSSHHSTSARIDVHYPSSWEGFISAQTVSGSISVGGEGITIIKNKRGYVYKEVLAKKGPVNEGEGSYIELGTISGSVNVVVRD